MSRGSPHSSTHPSPPPRMSLLPRKARELTGERTADRFAERADAEKPSSDERVSPDRRLVAALAFLRGWSPESGRGTCVPGRDPSDRQGERSGKRVGFLRSSDSRGRPQVGTSSPSPSTLIRLDDERFMERGEIAAMPRRRASWQVTAWSRLGMQARQGSRGRRIPKGQRRSFCRRKQRLIGGRADLVGQMTPKEQLSAAFSRCGRRSTDFAQADGRLRIELVAKSIACLFFLRRPCRAGRRDTACGRGRRT